MQTTRNVIEGSMTAFRVGFVILTLLTSTVLAPKAWGQTEPDSRNQSEGLKGLLPAEPPSHLVETLGRFPETWRSWADGISSELNTLYSETPSNVAAQQAILARLKTRIRTIERSLADLRYDSMRKDLIEVRGTLIKHVDLFEAVLDTLSAQEAATFTNSARESLQRSLASLNGYLAQVVGGEGWKTYLRIDEVGRSLASGSQNTPALDEPKRSLRNLQWARKSNDAAVRDFCERPVLKRYLIDLDRAVTAFEHATSGIQWRDVRGEFKSLLEGLQQHEESKLLSAAQLARTAFDKLRRLAPNGGDRLTHVLRRYYLNSNFQASISEGFLNRAMATTRVEAGGVRDYILGADVYGNQTTSSFSSVNLIPSNSVALLQIQLNGDVASNTEAYASRAVIYTHGNHHFDGFKDVRFDGTQFSTSPAMLNVLASNQPVGASTRADGIPILAGIARRIALRAANRDRPETEAIAVQRVDSRVTPRFNEEVDSAFARLNAELQDKVTAPLKSEQLYPDYISAGSTESELILSTRLMPDAKLGGGAAPQIPVGPEDIVFSFHESLLNNALDPLPIAGRTMSESELKQTINQKLRIFFPNRELVGSSVATPATEPGEPKRIIFTETDPLRVQLENGNLLLVLRAGFERDEDRGGNIPPQVITVPLMISLAGNEIRMTRGDISIEPIAANDNVAQQVLLSGVIRSKMEKTFPNTSASASTFTISRGDKSLNLRVIQMVIENGWLSVRAQSEPGARPF